MDKATLTPQCSPGLSAYFLLSCVASSGNWHFKTAHFIFLGNEELVLALALALALAQAGSPVGEEPGPPPAPRRCSRDGHAGRHQGVKARQPASRSGVGSPQERQQVRGSGFLPPRPDPLFPHVLGFRRLVDNIVTSL